MHPVLTWTPRPTPAAPTSPGTACTATERRSRRRGAHVRRRLARGRRQLRLRRARDRRRGQPRPSLPHPHDPGRPDTSARTDPHRGGEPRERRHVLVGCDGRHRCVGQRRRGLPHLPQRLTPPEHHGARRVHRHHGLARGNVGVHDRSDRCGRKRGAAERAPVSILYDRTPPPPPSGSPSRDHHGAADADVDRRRRRCALGLRVLPGAARRQRRRARRPRRPSSTVASPPTEATPMPCEASTPPATRARRPRSSARSSTTRLPRSRNVAAPSPTNRRRRSAGPPRPTVGGAGGVTYSVFRDGGARPRDDGRRRASSTRAALAEGPHTYTVVATDAAGNASAESLPAATRSTSRPRTRSPHPTGASRRRARDRVVPPSDALGIVATTCTGERA